MSSFNNIFNQSLKENRLEEYSLYSEKFYNLFTALTETNKLYNLTAVTDEEGVSSLHFADSLMAVKYIKGSGRLLDIGCGAGFPSLPIAIVREDLCVCGIDSTAKKIAFSSKFAEENGIKNFVSKAARAEELALTPERESYDYVTARAVARLNILSEFALPFVKVGGYFIALKGAIGNEEYKEAEKAIKSLGGRLEKIEKEKLLTPKGEQERTFIIIKKISKTPAIYPRAYSKIAKKPL